MEDSSEQEGLQFYSESDTESEEEEKVDKEKVKREEKKDATGEPEGDEGHLAGEESGR